MYASRPFLFLFWASTQWIRENPRLCHNRRFRGFTASHLYIRLTPQVLRSKTVTPNRSSYRLMVDV